MGNRKWTEEEESWMREHWGEKSYGMLARRFNRTEKAVQIKAKRLKLEKIITDRISLAEFSKIYYRCSRSVSHLVEKKFKKIGVKIYVFALGRTPMKYFKIDDFWEAVKKHPDKINLKRIEENILGKEPPYIKELRKQQVTDDRIKPWTDHEINLMRQYVKVGYSSRQIAGLLQRSFCSVASSRKKYCDKVRKKK